MGNVIEYNHKESPLEDFPEYKGKMGPSNKTHSHTAEVNTS